MKKFLAVYPFKRLHHTLMLAFLLLSLLPLTLVALFFLNAYSQDLQKQSTAHLLSVRDSKQQQIHDYLNAQEAEVLGFVASELAYASGGHFYGLIDAFRRLRPDIEQARQYAQRRYLPESGNKIKTSVAKDDPNYSATERYRLLHQRYHRAYQALLAPRESNGIQTLLVGKDGQVRAQSATSKAITNSTPVMDKALAGNTGVTRYQSPSGNTLLAAYTPIDSHGLKWGLVAEVPTQVAFARIHQLEQLFIVAMLLATLAVVVASHYVSNFITRPLLQLTWAAEKVSAGDLDTQIHHTRRPDEVGRLAVSFARMRHAIREKIQLIQQQNKTLEANLTIIKAQNQELQLANTLKDEFLATTSHELRTPLHGMIGIAEAMIDGANGPISRDHRYH